MGIIKKNEAYAEGEERKKRPGLETKGTLVSQRVPDRNKRGGEIDIQAALWFILLGHYFKHALSHGTHKPLAWGQDLSVPFSRH